MKHLFLALVLMTVSFCLSAQSGVTTSWPYLYHDFSEGVITLTTGPQESALMNIHLAQGRIHYIDKQNNIREANTRNLVKADIAGSEFIIREGMLLKVLASSEAGVVASHIVADMSSINETGGAYGVSSSTLSTQKLSSIQSNSVNMNHMELMSHRDEGQPIGLKVTYYLVMNGKCLEANKKAVSEYLPSERQGDFKSFLKSHKTNWKNASDLEAVLSFLNS